MFEEFEEVVLAEYNKNQDTPVNKFDRYFKAYLIGVMSVMISDKTYADTIRIWTKESN